MNTALLLVLADGRFPAGGHAHSGGVEEAVNDMRIAGLGDLRAFLCGRLHTTGLVNAALVAAACRAGHVDAWKELDGEADARIASPALREASRRQGRQLLRAARGVWPSRALDDLAASVPEGPHQPVALGAAAAAAGLTPAGAALVAAHEAVAGPATAAVRLLGLDPVAATKVVADLGGGVDRVAQSADGFSAGDPRDLPAASAPLIELGGEAHARREVRLFAS